MSVLKLDTMKNISAVVFLISGVIHSIAADRTLPEILTQVWVLFRFMIDWHEPQSPDLYDVSNKNIIIYFR